LLVGVAIVVVGAVIVAAGLWVTRPDPQTDAVLVTASSDVQSVPDIGDVRAISAAMRIEGDSRLFLDQNARLESSIASMAKVITALVVLDAAPLAPGESGPTWVVTDADVELFVTLSVNGAVTLPLIEGFELSQRQLLEAMLVPSSAVHAYVLVESVFGSVDAYRKAAAEWLLREGFGSTHVVDPVGGSAVTRSTPAELLAIGERALEHPVIAEIVALPEVDVPASGRVSNTNPFIGTNGIDGVKTGTLSSDAGYCLLFSIAPDLEQGRPRIFGVVLGAESAAERVDLVEQMIDLAITGFAPVELEAGETVARYLPGWSDPVELVLAESVSAVTWNGLAPRLDARTLTGASRGEVVGTVEYWSSTGVRAVEVRLADDLPEAPWWWRILYDD
jgi:D-alanyl-D-alanine carboxypeptidase (penicillin-binding protein 5/6)